MKRHNEKNSVPERIRENKLHRRWKIIAAVSAALAVVVTAALLTLPGITQEAGKDLTPYITSITMEKIVGNEWVAGTEFISGDAIRVTLYYTVGAGTVTSDAKTVYYQLPNGIGLDEKETGAVWSDSEEVGTYEIDPNGLITITFYDAFADGSAFTGYLTFEGLVTATGEGGQESIDFGAAGAVITVTPKEEETDISISKTGWYEEDTEKIYYSIIVSTVNGTDGLVQITDAFITENIIYDMDFPYYPLKIVHSSGREITGYQHTVDNAAQPAAFVIADLPKLEAGESYTITYAALPDLNSAEANGYLQFTNKAAAQDEANAAEAQINTIVSKSMIYKEGSYYPLTGKVTWTISLNEDMRDIRGYTLTDTVTCRDANGNTYVIPLPDAVTITPYVGTAPAGESMQVSLPFTFPDDLTTPYDTCYYLVTYETKLPQDVPAGTALTISNHAFFGGYEASAEVDVTTPEELTYDVEKTFISMQDQNQTINWAAIIAYPQDPAVSPDSLTYIDWVMDILRQDETFLPGTHYTTANLLAGAVISSTDETIRLVSGEDYTIYAVPQSAMADFSGLTAAHNSQYTDLSKIDRAATWYTLEQIRAGGNADEPLALFKIVFAQSALDKLDGQSILLQYQTRVDTEKLPLDTLLTMPNLASIPSDSSYATAQHTFTEKLHKQVSPTGVTENSLDTSSYTDAPLMLRSSEIHSTLHYRILIADYSEYSSVGEITVTDTLPAGADLVEDSVILRRHPSGGDSFTDATNDSWYLRAVSAAKNQDGTTTVTFTVGHINEFYNEPFGIYYEVSVADDPAWASSEVQTYINTASFDGTTDSTTTTVKKTQPVLSKTGEELESGIVRYYVTVNPEGLDLDTSSSTLTLVDSLSLPSSGSASFRADSVAVYTYDPTQENGCGNPMPADSYLVQYDEDTYTITFTLPDSTACVVTYEYAVHQGSTAGELQISNCAVLSGVAKGSAEKNITVASQSSAAGANKAALTVYKHDAESVKILLPGARFRLERYEQQEDGSAWVQTSLTGQGEDRTFTVGGSGYIELSFVEHAQDGSLYNTLYRLTEVEAPAGYEAGTTAYYFVFMEQGATEAATREAMREVWTAAGVEPDTVKFIVYSAHDSLYIPNMPTALTVEKVWQDENGAPLSDPPESVTVTLYQIGQDGGRTIYETVTLDASNDWTHSWSGLPKTDENGEEYRYAAEEEPIPGYAVTYSINNTAGIQAGVLVITNIKEEVYILPETGSTGPFLHITAGMLLTGAACAGFLYQRHRYRRKEGKHSQL